MTVQLDDAHFAAHSSSASSGPARTRSRRARDGESPPHIFPGVNPRSRYPIKKCDGDGRPAPSAGSSARAPVVGLSTSIVLFVRPSTISNRGAGVPSSALEQGDDRRPGLSHRASPRARRLIAAYSRRPAVCLGSTAQLRRTARTLARWMELGGAHRPAAKWAALLALLPCPGCRSDATSSASISITRCMTAGMVPAHATSRRCPIALLAPGCSTLTASCRARKHEVNVELT